MGNYAAHVWTIIITFITAILALIVWFYGYADLNNTLYADNLQDATRTALYAAQDKADRTERGTFVINKRVFDNVLGHTSVKQFGGRTVADMNHTRIYYLPDTSKADEYGPDNPTTGSNLIDPTNNKKLGSHENGQTDNHTPYHGNPQDKTPRQNNHNVSTGSSYVEGTNEKQPWIMAYDSADDKDSGADKDSDTLHVGDANSKFTHTDNDYETIRGIRVVVDGPTPTNIGFSDKSAKELNHEANDNNYDYKNKAGFHGSHNGDKNIPDKSNDNSTVNENKNNVDKYNSNGSNGGKNNILTQFTATDIIQTFGKNASNDTFNDLTR